MSRSAFNSSRNASRHSNASSVRDNLSEDDNYYDAIAPVREEDDFFYENSMLESSTQPYTRLQQLAGLSSPHALGQGRGSADDDPRFSNISSLSSDHHQSPNVLLSRNSPMHDFDAVARALSVQPNDLQTRISLLLSSDSKRAARLVEQELLTRYNAILNPGTARKLTPPSHEPVKPLANVPTYMKISTTSAATEPVLSGNIRLAQVLSRHEGPVWVTKFSPDGKYLCSAGQDTKVYVWVVGMLPLATSASSMVGNYDEEDSQSIDSKEERRDKETVEFVHNEPYRIFEGHSSDVVDVAWSKSNFILSASLDKTVSLWLVSSAERIQFFVHPDIVTSVDFHPVHDRYFISGCFDRRIRFWDILPDGHVRAWAQAPETVTSVSFDPQGQYVVAGLFNGQVYFYTFDMKYITQISCKNSSGKYQEGKKVTGLVFMKKESAGVTGSTSDEPSALSYRPKIGSIREKLFVTTNDNRVRLIQTEDFSLLTKYRGAKNSSMQIKASISEDGKYLICGSENGRVVIWNVAYSPKASWLSMLSKHNAYTNHDCEYIDSTESADVPCTTAIFAPSNTIYHLLVANRTRARDGENLLIESIKPQCDAVLQSYGIDYSDFSSRLVVAADSSGSIRIYIRESS